MATFHAFCTRLLQDEALEAGVDPFLSPVTPADRLALLLERIDELSLRHHEIRGNPAPLLASFVSRIDRLKDEMVSAADYRGYAEQLADTAEGDAARASAAPRARVRPPLRRPRPAAGRARRARLRRPDPARLPAAARAPARARARVPALPARAGRRVPGHELRPGHAAAAAGRGAPRRHRRGRRRPGDLPLPRRLAEEPARLRARASPTPTVVRLERNYRSGRRILDAATAVVAPVPDRIEKKLKGASGGRVRFWRCRSERAQAQAVAAEAERLIAGGRRRPTRSPCWCARSRARAPVVAAALEERALPVPPARRRRLLPARRGARRAGLAARCWPTRPTRARWCARSRARRSSCARWTWPG